MAVNPIKVWNGTAWEYTGPVVAAPPVKYQATAPTSPATGDVWVESDYDVASVDPSKLLTGGVYTNESTRSAAIPTPTTGMVTYVGDTGTESPSSTIPQLETYTGSAWKTPYGSTLLANVSFTTASSVVIDNVFSSLYDDYDINVSFTACSGANEDVNIQGRTGGTTISSVWVSDQISQNLNSVTSNQATVGRIGSISSSYPAFCNPRVNLVNPFLPTKTTWVAHSIFINSSGQVNTRHIMGYYDGNNSFDGMVLLPSAGTISGNIRIYGLRKS